MGQHGRSNERSTPRHEENRSLSPCVFCSFDSRVRPDRQASIVVPGQVEEIVDRFKRKVQLMDIVGTVTLLRMVALLMKSAIRFATAAVFVFLAMMQEA